MRKESTTHVVVVEDAIVPLAGQRFGDVQHAALGGLQSVGDVAGVERRDDGRRGYLGRQRVDGLGREQWRDAPLLTLAACTSTLALPRPGGRGAFDVLRAGADVALLGQPRASGFSTGEARLGGR